MNQHFNPTNVDETTPAQTLGRGRNWQAAIELQLQPRPCADGQRTALTGLRHHGPLRVQRPFYPEGPVCHVYLLHPPGGLVSGDQLEINAQLAEHSQALITTPSAGKIYKGDSCAVPQQQRLRLQLGREAELEWLPQETILFDGALGRSQTHIQLSGDSRFIGWEILCLGRPANRIRFEQGRFDQQLQIWRDDTPLLLEKQQLLAGSPLATRRWGLQNYPIVGNAYACGFEQEPTDLIDALREQLEQRDPALDEQVAISWRLDLLCIRYLGHDSEQARHCFTDLWRLIRPALLGRKAGIPRIWLT